MPKKTKTQNLSREDVAQKALNLSEALGWSHLTMRDIADECDISLADLQKLVCDKQDVLCALGRLIDHRTLQEIGSGGAQDVSGSARDRVFEIMMARFDVLNDYRAGLISILESFKTDPKPALLSLPHLGNSMHWMLEAAGLETNDLRGSARIIGLTAIYLQVLKTWREDESEDLSKTMAALDKHLARVERFAESFNL